MSLMFSISGVRGIVGENLNPDVLVKYSSAFAQFCNNGNIVVGRDGRITGEVISNIVISTLISMGCNVVDLGVVPTPTVALAVEKLKASGGVTITASHNPIQWNGLKFISSDGIFLNAEENNKLWGIVKKQDFKYKSWDKIGKHFVDNKFTNKHIDLILQMPYLNIEQIEKRKFKIVVDCINAAGGLVVPKLLRELGCEVIELNCSVSGIFVRNPEPIPENLKELCQYVKKNHADLGIAVDPDVDRLVLINEKGEPYGEEYTISTVVNFILSKVKKRRNTQSVVVNLSTTRAVDDIAKTFNAKVFRTPVGEINVAQKMKEVKAIIGGEGSGGVILPEVHYCRDALVGIALILQQLTEFNGTLSELKQTLPAYAISKKRIDINDKDSDNIFDKIKAKIVEEAIINTDDGLKIDFKDSWIHLRKSNTEPIIRIIAEAPTKAQADILINDITNQI